MSQAVTSALPVSEPASERFRPNPWGWLQVVFLGFCSWLFGMMSWGALFSPVPKGVSHDDSPIAALVLCIVGFFFVIMALLAVRLATSEVRISENHLSWRTWRGTQTVLWKDVLDYFETDQPGLYVYDSGPKRKFLPTRDFQVSLSCLVKTPYGDCQFSQAWPHARRLREVIAARAVNARAREWGLLGVRPELDLPTTFRYENAMSRGVALARLILYGLVAFMIFGMGPLMWSTTRRIAPVVGWVSAMGPILMMLAALLFPTIFAFLSLPDFGEIRRRWSQSITLTERGIRYDDGGRTVEARWDEITDLTSTTMKQLASVDTRHGSFDFRATIRHYQILKSAIETMTRESVPAGWQPKPKERLDKPYSQVIASKSFAEYRFFSYRTRINRAIALAGSVYFWGFTAILGRYALILGKYALHIPLSLGMRIFSGAICSYLVAGSLLTLWGWRSYLVAGIRTDAEGITQLTVLGPKRIGWMDVRAVKSVGAGAVTWVSISDGKQRIWFTPLIADAKELLAEIKSRTRQEPELS